KIFLKRKMKCKFIKPDGTQCNANAMSGLDYCWTHNPDISDEEKREAKQRGGQARALTIANPLPELPINEPNDAVLLIVDTINRVRSGELDIKTANCLGFLTDKLLKAFEVSKLNDRVEIIERVILEKKTRY
ncbi:MAG TPA: hypothetical protein PLC05_03400, partial [bacterium]|nr:hypothetical protein [bacterium]